MLPGAVGWLLASFFLHLAGALVCVGAAAWILRKGDRQRPDRNATMAALLLTALWCVIFAAYGERSVLAAMAETARNLAWINVLYRLFAADGRHESLKPIRPVIGALAFVEGLQPVLLVFQYRLAITPALSELTFEVQAMFRVLVAIGALVLLHNLYVGASTAMRQVLRWTATSLAVLWAYELNLHTVAYLTEAVPVELLAVRGLAFAFVAAGLAVGVSANARSPSLRPSRAMAFQSLSLLVIGGYLLIMLGIAGWLDILGGGYGRLTQVGFLFAAVAVAMFCLPSKRLRSWMRVTVVKHLFQHRYDYRAEWLRFTRTIGSGEGGSLTERVAQAMADITDSPSSLLLLPSEEGGLTLASRWQWRTLPVPAEAVSPELAALLGRAHFILDLDEVRSGIDHHGELGLVPEWLLAEDQAWALVPLLHFDRLTGVVVLARPAVARRLDWEDFDLLKLAGQQLASYLAEQSTQQALMEAERFDEFNRRIAFVMHDIKNLASQLSLLARNAELHADNPDFRADMLVTLRNSSEKLNALLARLGRYGASGKERRIPVPLDPLCRRVAAKFAGGHAVQYLGGGNAVAVADPEALEQALDHLVQNAVDASDASYPVMLELSAGATHARLQVVDSGTGMSADFVRNGLFKPFVSSKSDGFGIGAFEARELVRGMGGRLDVESREGLGTRFNITLPLSAAAGLSGADGEAEGKEVA